MNWWSVCLCGLFAGAVALFMKEHDDLKDLLEHAASSPSLVGQADWYFGAGARYVRSRQGFALFVRDTLNDAEVEQWRLNTPPSSSSSSSATLHHEHEHDPSQHHDKQFHSLQRLHEVATSPIVLLLHGYPTSSVDFAELYDHYSLNFSSSFHVVAGDFFGFGMSDKPESGNFSIAYQADCVEDILFEVLRLRTRYHPPSPSSTPNIPQVRTQLLIVAHDYGVTVAQELLARFQLHRQLLSERHQSSSTAPAPLSVFSKVELSSIVFLNGGLFPESHHAKFVQKALLVPVIGPLFSRLTPFFLFRRSFISIFGPATPPSPQQIDLAWALLNYKQGKHVLPKLQRYMIERVEQRPRWVGALTQEALRRVECHQQQESHSQSTSFDKCSPSSFVSIRVINGPADPVSGLHVVNRYRELIAAPAVDVVLLSENIGHYPHWEAPLEVRQAIDDFFVQQINTRRGLKEEHRGGPSHPPASAPKSTENAS